MSSGTRSYLQRNPWPDPREKESEEKGKEDWWTGSSLVIAGKIAKTRPLINRPSYSEG
jgi:hypothetical protein